MASINFASNPVEQAYGGGDTLNVRKLQEFCNTTSSNFTALSHDVSAQRLRLSELYNINAKLIQFMNWLAVTNPQILDEFQNTAHAFEKLTPRAAAESESACASP